MKRNLAMLIAGVTGAILCASAVVFAASSDVDEPGVGGTRVPTYRCRECNAPNGGCYYPLCPDCHNKQCPPVKPIVPPVNPNR